MVPQSCTPAPWPRWKKCAGPDDPNGVDPTTHIQYCDSSNNHFGKDPNNPKPDGYSEPTWANGGSLPFIFPYLALPHIAFRIAPVKQFQMRIDTGFAFSGGFYVGFAAGGRLPI